MNLEVFTGLLKNTKCQIDTALSGADALKLLDQNKYDLIFLDHMMPEMDGIEVLVRLRANKSGINAKTPVIMFTANALMGADKKYLDNGFDDYLSKPIRPFDLENMIIKHLPEHLVIYSNISADATNAPLEDKSSSAFIDSLNFIDTTAGLEFAAGDEDFYRQILTTYVTEDKRPSLNDLYQKEDWPNYQIVAHSLKGTSMTIGALRLSEEAKGLEFAVKENRIEYIRIHHTEVIEHYSALLEKLKKVL